MTQALGKTIQVFLPDGNPRCVKIAESTSRTIQAVLVPRAQLDFACTRGELKNVGLYVLFGDAGSGNLPLLYIGEAAACSTRLIFSWHASSTLLADSVLPKSHVS